MNRRGYSIFINSFFEGPVPSVTELNGDDLTDLGNVCVFPTEREAQLEIVDAMMIRLQEFIDGEREFEDAVTLEEYVVEVEVLADSSVARGGADIEHRVRSKRGGAEVGEGGAERWIFDL